MGRANWKNVFINIAELIKQRSTCLKIKTACVITKGTQIKSIGYNGTYPHKHECDEYWKSRWRALKRAKTRQVPRFCEWLQTPEFRDAHREWSSIYEIHGESNALDRIKKGKPKYDLYTIYSPCIKCACEIIRKKSIKRVYYKTLYRRNGQKAIKLLRKNNIRVKCIDTTD